MVYLTDLAEACRKSGLKVVEIDGWRTRGRPASTGGFNPQGVLCHHTGGDADSVEYVRWMALEGRSDLPAPLCQIALGRDATVYVCAAGRANHAGDAKAQGTIPAGDGNELYLGIEALNNGSEGFSEVQYGAFVRLCRTLCDHYGWEYTNVRGHKETSVTGKWDPGMIDMNKFRGGVVAADEKEDEVSAADIWRHQVPVIGGKQGETEGAQWALARGRKDAREAEAHARAALEQAKRNRKAIAALAAELNNVAPGVAQAVADALGDEIQVTVKVEAGGAA